MADLITLIGFAWKPSIKTQPVIIIDFKRVSAMDSRGSISYLDPHNTPLTRKSRTHKPTSSSIETAAKVIKFPILTIHS